MTVTDASRALGISEPTVTQRARALVADGKLTPHEGRDWIFSAADLELLRNFKDRGHVRKTVEKRPPRIETPVRVNRGSRGYGVSAHLSDGAEDVPREE